ncbi:MAG: sirohydrochlorin cobaltochelatase [Campylobacterota bacterium]|nr:sirohydrochlorin cobaltochelatase [Campylobacterota bacterium]
MKRYRHYKKDKAIILSCFGSVIEQDKYLDLKYLIEKTFKDIDVFLSFSSRMVLNDLHKRDMDYKNLPQVLADVDMLGYKNIMVASINLFPTDEHEMLKKTVDGFNNFSLANIRYTNAILTKSKDTTLFLKALDADVTKKDSANLYVIHGTPALELGGIESITYSANFLEMIGDANYSCSLEGAFPFYALKEQLIKKMKKDGVKNIQVIPMLLVSGNHYIKDMVEIKDELSSDFNASIVETLTSGERFNLIELENSTNIIINNIKEEIIKLG